MIWLQSYNYIQFPPTSLSTSRAGQSISTDLRKQGACRFFSLNTIKLYLDLFKVTCFLLTLYHDKPPLNHHLGECSWNLFGASNKQIQLFKTCRYAMQTNWSKDIKSKNCPQRSLSNGQTSPRKDDRIKARYQYLKSKNMIGTTPSENKILRVSPRN